jgi:hypothetical protein
MKMDQCGGPRLKESSRRYRLKEPDEQDEREAEITRLGKPRMIQIQMML